eukprot:gene2978-5769_t
MASSACAIGGGTDEDGFPMLDSCLAGLGKTFIAAVVMYNFYRWYPTGKIVFMAPTKPLVAQQVQACYQIMGFPREDVCEITGSKPPATRRKLWEGKRIFFLTPQVLQNDLRRDVCPAKSIVCLVVDEAHRALGKHSYSTVVQCLCSHTERIRIIALSATPGDTISIVQQIINNLRISHIELRNEKSIDIRPYINQRKVEVQVVPPSDDVKKFKAKMYQIVSESLNRLGRAGALGHTDPARLSSFRLLTSRDAFRRMNQHSNSSRRGQVEGDFAMSISILHSIELLSTHGIVPFYQTIQSYLTGEKQQRVGQQLRKNSEFMSMLAQLEEQVHLGYFLFDISPSRVQALDPINVYKGHPKLAKLEELVISHFQHMKSQQTDTRVIVFSSFRDSVLDISKVLAMHSPLVRVASFIGQASGRGKSSKGQKQSEQIAVVSKFRQGVFNTLVATCVGEEGLDIGHVDLIVCFDSQGSSTRLVQRMGRTGRQRNGHVVQLLTEGSELNNYRRSSAARANIQEAIINAAQKFQMYSNSPRMLPEKIKPRLTKVFIQPQIRDWGELTQDMPARKRAKHKAAHLQVFRKLHLNRKLQKQRKRAKSTELKEESDDDDMVNFNHCNNIGDDGGNHTHTISSDGDEKSNGILGNQHKNYKHAKAKKFNLVTSQSGILALYNQGFSSSEEDSDLESVAIISERTNVRGEDFQPQLSKDLESILHGSHLETFNDPKTMKVSAREQDTPHFQHQESNNFTKCPRTDEHRINSSTIDFGLFSVFSPKKSNLCHQSVSDPTIIPSNREIVSDDINRNCLQDRKLHDCSVVELSERQNMDDLEQQQQILSVPNPKCESHSESLQQNKGGSCRGSVRSKILELLPPIPPRDLTVFTTRNKTQGSPGLVFQNEPQQLTHKHQLYLNQVTNSKPISFCHQHDAAYDSIHSLTSTKLDGADMQSQSCPLEEWQQEVFLAVLQEMTELDTSSRKAVKESLIQERKKQVAYEINTSKHSQVSQPQDGSIGHGLSPKFMSEETTRTQCLGAASKRQDLVTDDNELLREALQLDDEACDMQLLDLLESDSQQSDLIMLDVNASSDQCTIPHCSKRQATPHLDDQQKSDSKAHCLSRGIDSESNLDSATDSKAFLDGNRAFHVRDRSPCNSKVDLDQIHCDSSSCHVKEAGDGAEDDSGVDANIFREHIEALLMDSDGNQDDMAVVTATPSPDMVNGATSKLTKSDTNNSQSQCQQRNQQRACLAYLNDSDISCNFEIKTTVGRYHRSAIDQASSSDDQDEDGSSGNFFSAVVHELDRLEREQTYQEKSEMNCASNYTAFTSLLEDSGDEEEKHSQANLGVHESNMQGFASCEKKDSKALSLSIDTGNSEIAGVIKPEHGQNQTCHSNTNVGHLTQKVDINQSEKYEKSINRAAQIAPQRKIQNQQLKLRQSLGISVTALLENDSDDGCECETDKEALLEDSKIIKPVASFQKCSGSISCSKNNGIELDQPIVSTSQRTPAKPSFCSTDQTETTATPAPSVHFTSSTATSPSPIVLHKRSRMMRRQLEATPPSTPCESSLSVHARSPSETTMSIAHSPQTRNQLKSKDSFIMLSSENRVCSTSRQDFIYSHNTDSCCKRRLLLHKNEHLSERCSTKRKNSSVKLSRGKVSSKGKRGPRPRSGTATGSRAARCWLDDEAEVDDEYDDLAAEIEEQSSAYDKEYDNNNTKRKHSKKKKGNSGRNKHKQHNHNSSSHGVCNGLTTAHHLQRLVALHDPQIKQGIDDDDDDDDDDDFENTCVRGQRYLKRDGQVTHPGMSISDYDESFCTDSDDKATEKDEDEDEDVRMLDDFASQDSFIVEDTSSQIQDEQSSHDSDDCKNATCPDAVLMANIYRQSLLSPSIHTAVMKNQTVMNSPSPGDPCSHIKAVDGEGTCTAKNGAFGTTGDRQHRREFSDTVHHKSSFGLSQLCGVARLSRKVNMNCLQKSIELASSRNIGRKKSGKRPREKAQLNGEANTVEGFVGTFFGEADDAFADGHLVVDLDSYDEGDGFIVNDSWCEEDDENGPYTNEIHEENEARGREFIQHKSKGKEHLPGPLSKSPKRISSSPFSENKAAESKLVSSHRTCTSAGYTMHENSFHKSTPVVSTGNDSHATVNSASESSPRPQSIQGSYSLMCHQGACVSDRQKSGQFSVSAETMQEDAWLSRASRKWKTESCQDLNNILQQSMSPSHIAQPNQMKQLNRANEELCVMTSHEDCSNPIYTATPPATARRRLSLKLQQVPRSSMLQGFSAGKTNQVLDHRSSLGQCLDVPSNAMATTLPCCTNAITKPIDTPYQNGTFVNADTLKNDLPKKRATKVNPVEDSKLSKTLLTTNSASEACIFINDRQLQTTGYVVSSLRDDHHLQTCTVSMDEHMPSFVLSARMAVLRLVQTDVLGWHLKATIYKQILHGVSAYGRFYVIVENMRVKEGISRSRAGNETCLQHRFQQHQKYHRHISLLARTKAIVLTAVSAKDTASIVIQLMEGEVKKGIALSAAFSRYVKSPRTMQLAQLVEVVSGCGWLVANLLAAVEKSLDKIISLTAQDIVESTGCKSWQASAIVDSLAQPFAPG